MSDDDNKLLTKDDIFNAQDKQIEYVDVPEWANGDRCQVKLRTMSGGERDAFESMCMGPNGGTNYRNIRAKLISQCIIDEKGKQMFTKEDIVKLSNKSAKAINRVFDACQRLNGLTDNDVEELAKN